MLCHFITFVQTAKFLICDCLNIFDQAKIARWRHYSAHNFKRLYANYMLVRYYVYIGLLRACV